MEDLKDDEGSEAHLCSRVTYSLQTQLLDNKIFDIFIL